MIDVHAHVQPVIPRPDSHAGLPDLWVRVDGERGMMMRGDEEYRPVDAPLWDPALRVADLDKAGVEQQVICVPPLLFGYDLDPVVGSEWAAMMNDLVLEQAGQFPDRLLPLCQVPLQDTAAACASVDRAVATGHRGVQIGNHIDDRALTDEGIIAFLNHCARTGVPVFVHPWGMSEDPRMKPHMMQWLVGMPAETHLAILGLMLEGGFDRLDPDLRICFAHGGGSMAFLLGRADNAWRRRDIVRERSSRPPSEYVDRFCVDSAVFEPGALGLLVDTMGSQRVLLGSDYPFPLGEESIGALVASSALSEAQKADVFGLSARRWLDG